jgi:hypothetical protein
MASPPLSVNGALPAGSQFASFVVSTVAYWLRWRCSGGLQERLDVLADFFWVLAHVFRQRCRQVSSELHQ